MKVLPIGVQCKAPQQQPHGRSAPAAPPAPPPNTHTHGEGRTRRSAPIPALSAAQPPSPPGWCPDPRARAHTHRPAVEAAASAAPNPEQQQPAPWLRGGAQPNQRDGAPDRSHRLSPAREGSGAGKKLPPSLLPAGARRNSVVICVPARPASASPPCASPLWVRGGGGEGTALACRRNALCTCSGACDPRDGEVSRNKAWPKVPAGARRRRKGWSVAGLQGPSSRLCPKGKGLLTQRRNEQTKPKT